jgi:hypothetical protein
MIDDECGAVGGMKIGRGNRGKSTCAYLNKHYAMKAYG